VADSGNAMLLNIVKNSVSTIKVIQSHRSAAINGKMLQIKFSLNLLILLNFLTYLQSDLEGCFVNIILERNA
jgi:hypothetical protein